MSPTADSPRRHTLPRQRRVTRQRDFDRVYEAHCTAADAWLVVFAAGNDLGRPRVGLAVSRKLGNAVRRNRIKRLLREAFRLGQHDLPAGFDYVLIPRAAQVATAAQYRQSLPPLAALAAKRWMARRCPTTDERRIPNDERRTKSE